MTFYLRQPRTLRLFLLLNPPPYPSTIWNVHTGKEDIKLGGGEIEDEGEKFETRIHLVYLSFEAYAKCSNCSTSNLWRETNTSRCLSPSYCQSSVTERCIHFRFLFSFNLSKSPVINSFGWVWPSLLVFLNHPFYHLFHIAIFWHHIWSTFSFFLFRNWITISLKFRVKVLDSRWTNGQGVTINIVHVKHVTQIMVGASLVGLNSLPRLNSSTPLLEIDDWIARLLPVYCWLVYHPFRWLQSLVWEAFWSSRRCC